MQRWITERPLCKFILDGSDDFFQSVEITVVQTLAARELPDSLDGIAVRAVRRQEIEPEMGLLLLPPVLVKTSMVIAGVIGDHGHRLAYWHEEGRTSGIALGRY